MKSTYVRSCIQADGMVHLAIGIIQLIFLIFSIIHFDFDMYLFIQPSTANILFCNYSLSSRIPSPTRYGLAVTVSSPRLFCLSNYAFLFLTFNFFENAPKIDFLFVDFYIIRFRPTADIIDEKFKK